MSRVESAQRKRQMKKHYETLRNIKSVLQTKDRTFYKRINIHKKFHRADRARLLRQRQIRTSNEKLIGKITDIATKPHTYYRQVYPSKQRMFMTVLSAHGRRIREAKILRENQKMAGRLLSRSSAYDRKEWANDWKKHDNLISNLSRLRNIPMSRPSSSRHMIRRKQKQTTKTPAAAVSSKKQPQKRTSLSSRGANKKRYSSSKPMKIKPRGLLPLREGKLPNILESKVSKQSKAERKESKSEKKSVTIVAGDDMKATAAGAEEAAQKQKEDRDAGEEKQATATPSSVALPKLKAENKKEQPEQQKENETPAPKPEIDEEETQSSRVEVKGPAESEPKPAATPEGKDTDANPEVEAQAQETETAVQESQVKENLNQESIDPAAKKDGDSSAPKGTRKEGEELEIPDSDAAGTETANNGDDSNAAAGPDEQQKQQQTLEIPKDDKSKVHSEATADFDGVDSGADLADDA